jgi:Putative transposase
MMSQLNTERVCYTHRVAIGNYRLLSMDNGGVTFKTRGEHTVTQHSPTFPNCSQFDAASIEVFSIPSREFPFKVGNF